MNVGTWRYATAAGLVALGVLLVVTQVGNFLRLVHLGPSSFLHAATLTLVSISPIYAGLWLARNDEYSKWTDRVFAWSVGGGVTFGAVALLSALALPSIRAPDTMTLLLDTMTAGSVAGVLLGLYDAQSRSRHVALQQERDRIERFAQQAASLNTYGKALNQSRTLHEVSALCIEVLELLIGSRDAAFVLVDDTVTVIDSTRRDAVELESIREFAREVARGEPMKTVRSPDDRAAGLPSDHTIAVPIPADDHTVAVLVALTDADTTYTDQDLDLLELLSAHVATALPDVTRPADEPSHTDGTV